MKNIAGLLYLLLPVLLCSCDTQRCEPNTLTTSFADQQTIQVRFDTSFQSLVYTIEEGGNLVFQRTFYNGHCEGNGDDWYTLMLSFEIDAASTSFTMKDSNLVSAHCFVHHTSTWLYEYYPVSMGYIEGQQLSTDEWAMHGDVAYIIPLTPPKKRNFAFDDVFRK